MSATVAELRCRGRLCRMQPTYQVVTGAPVGLNLWRYTIFHWLSVHYNFVTKPTGELYLSQDEFGQTVIIRLYFVAI